VIGHARARRARRALASGALAAAALAFAAAPAANAQTVTPGGGPPFPARALILTEPGNVVAPGAVHVTENGGPVGGLLVTPLTHARRGDFGVVIAIDSSTSMAYAIRNRLVAVADRPIGRAMDAARALAAGRSANQEIGVIEFANSARIVLPLTTATSAIDRALSVVPRAAGVAHIYDAAALGLRMLETARVAAGTVIVLSDGGDDGSRLRLAALVALARREHFTIDTVGVRDPFYVPSSLATLSSDAGGTFVAATPSQLRATLAGLETGLVNRYLIHYRSLAPLGAHVSVSVTVAGSPGSANLSYIAPPTPTRLPPVPKTFWTSKLALLCLSGGAALLLVIALLSLLAPHMRRETLRARVAQFTGGPTPAIVAAAAKVSERSVIDRWEDRYRDSPRWQRFNEELEIAGFGTTPLRYVGIAALATLAVGLLLALVTGAVWLLLPAFAAGALAARTLFVQRLAHQRRLFADGLAAHLQEIASAMRAGHSVTAAMRITAEGASEPARSEFAQVVADEQLGRPLSVALAPVERRMASRDIGHLAVITSVHDRSGGNMAEVLDRLADSVRERSDLQRELRSLTAQARLSRYIVTALPPVVVGAMALIEPGYLSPLFHTTTGVILLLLCGVLLVSGYFVMRKIVDIEV